MNLNPVMGALSDDDTRGRQHTLGKAGERLAAEYLENQGLAVLERNWRTPHGELDIVASDGQIVVFCEVKTRSGPDYGEPLEAVNEFKKQRVRALATKWLSENQLEGCRVQFDVLSVLWPPGGLVRIEHLKEAF